MKFVNKRKKWTRLRRLKGKGIKILEKQEEQTFLDIRKNYVLKLYQNVFKIYWKSWTSHFAWDNKKYAVPTVLIINY